VRGDTSVRQMGTLRLEWPASSAAMRIGVTLHFGRTEFEASASLPDGEPVRATFIFSTTA
jgi:hypothetical protein